MLHVGLTPAARDDLDALVAYAREQSPAGAARLLERLLDAIGSLAEFQDRHPVAAESLDWGREVRSMLVFRYRVLYAVRRDRVVVLRIIHGSMTPPANPTN